MTAAEWRVKYDGVCSRCGIALHAGEIAVYERPTRSIRCVVCPSSVEAEVVATDQEDALTTEPQFDPGTAGASARREYERRKAKREDRVKGRFGDRLGRVVLAVTDDPQSTRAWAIGASGEEQLAKALEGIEGLRVLNDRRVPGTRGNIDHIVIAPAGVFVVDAKRYEGRIEIRNKGWFLRLEYRLYVGRRDCSRLAEGLGWQVEAVATALAAAGVDPLPPITPVLCFIDGDWPLFGAPDEFAGVRLEGPKSLRKIATATVALEPDEIGRLARILAARLPSK
jgi:hypothetical protein